MDERVEKMQRHERVTLHKVEAPLLWDRPHHVDPMRERKEPSVAERRIWEGE